VRGRTVTIIAIGALGLDGALLILAGVWTGRSVFTLVGLACLVGGVLVWHYWKRYRRLLEELRHERAALGREAEELRRILRQEQS
jgi:uncharacterized membrane protein YccC